MLDVDDCPVLLTLSWVDALLAIRSEAIAQPDYVNSVELYWGF